MSEERRTVSEAATLKQGADERAASGVSAVASAAIRSATAAVEAIVARVKEVPTEPSGSHLGDLVEVETALQLALMSLEGAQAPVPAPQEAQGER